MDSLSATPTTSRNGLWGIHNTIVWFLLAVLLLQTIAPLAKSRTDYFITVAEGGGGRVQDFASLLTFTRVFWQQGADYKATTSQAITSDWAGQPVNWALPFPYSPTMLWILGPLSLLPTSGAYLVWTSCSAACLWWLTRSVRTVCIAGAVVVLNSRGMSNLALGQTAVLTTTACVFLAFRQLGNSRHTGGEAAKRSIWPDVLVLWALTAKPPLAILAGGALMAGRRWTTVAIAAALSLLTAALLTPRLGLEWPADYVHMVRTYDLDQADPIYAWSLHPEQMSNLRGVLYTTLGTGDHTAAKASSVAWLTMSLVIVLAGLLRRISVPAAWGLSMLAYVLFCPHVSYTDDLHVALAVALVAYGFPATDTRMRLSIVVAVLCVVLMPVQPAWAPAGLLLTIAFTLKLWLVGLVILTGNEVQPETPLARLTPATDEAYNS